MKGKTFHGEKKTSLTSQLVASRVLKSENEARRRVSPGKRTSACFRIFKYRTSLLTSCCYETFDSKGPELIFITVKI